MEVLGGVVMMVCEGVCEGWGVNVWGFVCGVLVVGVVMGEGGCERCGAVVVEAVLMLNKLTV